MTWVIATLFAIAFGGLATVLLRAVGEGMDRYAGAYSQQTAKQLEDVFLFIPPRRITEFGWAAAIAVFFLVFSTVGRVTDLRSALTALALATLAGAATLRLPTLIVQILRNRRLARFNLQLGDTLVSMSNALKAGFSIAQAIEAVVREGENPIAQEFEVFLQQTRVGVSFSQALQNLDDRVGSEDLKLVIVAIETARKTGGNLTEIFEQIAVTIRERLRIERRIRTLTAQGRLQGIIVSLMPVVIGCALVVVDPEMMLPFLHSSMGATIMVVVALLILAGGLVIRKIVRIDV
ncbi:MAG: type II secretion system F family protein [Verrucomicrobia bacterium]|nr:type II secretion system F family protein [Verrucomicrobiota bacterium]